MRTLILSDKDHRINERMLETMCSIGLITRVDRLRIGSFLLLRFLEADTPN